MNAMEPCTSHAIACCMFCIIDECNAAPRVYKNQIQDIGAAREKYPEAFVMFDSQLSDLAQLPCDFKRTRKDKIQVTFRNDDGTARVTANWHAGAGVWIRYSAGVTSKPNRHMRKYCVVPTPIDGVDDRDIFSDVDE